MKQLKIIFTFLLLFFPFLASASLGESLGLPAFGSRLNLPQDSSPGRIVVGIINALLGFLGVLFTILIIYGGFKWMLSQGNSQQVDEAKKVIKNAAIGLVIVLVSYSISRTILELIYESSVSSTSGGGGNPTPPPGGGTSGGTYTPPPCNPSSPDWPWCDPGPL